MSTPENPLFLAEILHSDSLFATGKAHIESTNHAAFWPDTLPLGDPPTTPGHWTLKGNGDTWNIEIPRKCSAGQHFHLEIKS